MFAGNNSFHFIDKMLQADISHGEYETYVPVLKEKFCIVRERRDIATGSCIGV
mgnify:CR=1 FL=1